MISKKAQISGFMTWFFAFIIIFFIMLIFVLLAAAARVKLTTENLGQISVKIDSPNENLATANNLLFFLDNSVSSTGFPSITIYNFFQKVAAASGDDAKKIYDGYYYTIARILGNTVLGEMEYGFIATIEGLGDPSKPIVNPVYAVKALGLDATDNLIKLKLNGKTITFLVKDGFFDKIYLSADAKKRLQEGTTSA